MLTAILVAALLASSTTEPADADTIDCPKIQPGPVGSVPLVPPWPDELPQARQEGDGTVALPKPLADAVMCRLATLNYYPQLAQVAMDATADAAVSSVRAGILSEQSELPSYLALAGAVVGGLGAGMLTAIVRTR